MLKKKGQYWYGTDAEDIRADIVRYSVANEHVAERFMQSKCKCGGLAFRLETDEDAGAARRKCPACSQAQFMGDSAEYADEADLENHICVCDGEDFELVSGVALFEGSNDVRWYYVGCRCVKCNLVGVFADWKCEAGDADAFLSAV